MSLKRKLASAAVISAAAATPFLSPVPAMAASTDPYLDKFNAAVDMSNLVQIVQAQQFCVITMEQTIAAAKPGVPVVVSTFPVTTVNWTPTYAYAVKVEGAVLAFVTCTLT